MTRANGWKVLAAATAMLLGMSLRAEAITVYPTNAIEQGNQTGTSAILAYLDGLGYPVDSELYKSDVGGPESGGYAGSYETTYSPTLDPDSATIRYSGGPAITGSPIYMLVKDGNASPAWYFFNLSALGWHGTETLNLRNFWPAQGAISHVAIYGHSTSVPDGGSMAMLLGLGMLGLASVRRRLS